jgi:two-component system, LuxR family, sensor kinase FixL
VRETIAEAGIQHVTEVQGISKNLVEKALRMRTESFLAQIKTQLLTQTILEIDKGKKEVMEAHKMLSQQHEQVRRQNDELERRVQERTTDLRKEIEERKKYEIALKQAHGELEIRVAERTKQLKTLNQDLEKEIVERKNAEKEIRKLSHAIEQSLSSIVITDCQGRIEYINPMFTTTTGYSSEEVIGETPSILKSGVHDQKFYQNLWQTIKAGNNWKNEICNRKKNGDLYWELQAITPIRDEKGNVSNFISVRMDDTERKQAEDQLKVYASELERSNNELEGFASIASHDLMEPLRKIMLFGDRVKEISPTLEQKPKEYIQKMQTAAARMNTLLKDLLTFSTVHTKPNSFVKVDLSEVMNDVQENLEKLVREVHGEIFVEKLPDVFGEPFQMRQLFQNLIANGLKFHSSKRLPQIHISCRNLSKEGVEVTVEDNGIGFDAKFSERIFGAFERLHGHSAYEGTGIGLAICKKIVELHGGTIRAESEPDKGSKFIIALPDKQKK